MTSLLTRLLSSKPKASHLRFTVYSRAQCCCCHKALDVLKEAQEHHGFTIEEIDVDTEAELAAKYGLEVPVVAVDGKVRFRGVVNRVLLDRLLDAEIRDRSSADESARA